MVILDLSENVIEEINLKNLASLKNLQSLSLQGNRIRTIDLFPLHRFQNLRELDLSRNCLQNVNLAPLLLCRNLDIVNVDETTLYNVVDLHIESSIPSVLIEAAIRLAQSEGRPKWVQNTKYNQFIGYNHYRELIAKLGWKSACEYLTRALRHVDTRDHLTAQREFFRALNMEELACYDGSIFDILMLLPNNETYDKGRENFYNAVIDLLKARLENSCSTNLFDVNKLSESGGVVLVPKILENRKQEMDNLVIREQEDRVDIATLRGTYYGKEILDALGVGEKADSKKVDEIEQVLASMGFSVCISE